MREGAKRGTENRRKELKEGAETNNKRANEERAESKRS